LDLTYLTTPKKYNLLKTQGIKDKCKTQVQSNSDHSTPSPKQSSSVGILV